MTVEDILFKTTEFSVRKPRLVLFLFTLLVACSVFFARTHLELKTSNLDLVDSEKEEIRKFLDLTHEFGTPHLILAVLESASGQVPEIWIDETAEHFRRIPGVRTVLHRIPVSGGKSETGLSDALASRDGKEHYLFVQPEDSSCSIDRLEPLIQTLRAQASELTFLHPALGIGFTGMPIYALDDKTVIQEDIRRLSVWSLLGVAVIFVVGFHCVFRPLFAVFALIYGVFLTLGAVVIYPGHLNLLTSSAASILFGLGIDYAIHIIHHVEDRSSSSVPLSKTLPEAVRELGRGLFTSMLTTGLAFWTMVFSGFKGFRELGWIALFGMLLCFVTMITLLPALLVLFPRSAARTRVLNWNVRSRLALLSHPIAAGIIVLVACAGCLHGWPEFDGNYLNLQPRDSETVRLEKSMTEKSDYSPLFAVFRVDTLAQASALEARLQKSPLVKKALSASAFFRLPALFPMAGLETLIPGFLRSPNGRFAVYAFPSKNVWDPSNQKEFIEAMTAINPAVSGMPFVGHAMIDMTRQALQKTSFLSLLILVIVIFLDFKRIGPTLTALAPALLTFGSLLGFMACFGVPLNPLNVMAFPVILGIAVDSGVHLVHRFLHEKGDWRLALSGTGRSILLSSLTTLCAFATLAFTRHPGLSSFASVLAAGVALSLLYSVVLLPAAFRAFRNRILPGIQGSTPPFSDPQPHNRRTS